MNKTIFLLATVSVIGFSCGNKDTQENKQKNKTFKTSKLDDKKKDEHQKNKEESIIEFPKEITIKGVALNPEGVEFNKKDNTFFLSSLNAMPIVKVNLDGTYRSFTSGEAFPLSTAGLQIDYKNNRLLAAGFNGTELMDNDPKTKGTAFLRIYNLETGVLEKDINLSSLVPDAEAYFANDIAVDNQGNVYVSDWYARVVYKVDLEGHASVFWRNETGISSGANGLDFHPDGYLLVSILNVNNKGVYTDFGLVKIPLENANLATLVEVNHTKYTGFDGLVLKEDGNIVGVTNSGTAPGGNVLMELSSNDGWKSAQEVSAIDIKASTTVAVTPSNKYYVLNQDFTDSAKENWTIEQIEFD